MFIFNNFWTIQLSFLQTNVKYTSQYLCEIKNDAERCQRRALTETNLNLFL